MSRSLRGSAQARAGRGSRDLYGCGGSQNRLGYCQRLLDAGLDQADLILDAAARRQLLNRADAQLANDVPMIPLFEVPSVTVLRSSVRGFGRGSLTDPMWNAEDWWLAR